MKHIFVKEKIKWNHYYHTIPWVVPLPSKFLVWDPPPKKKQVLSTVTGRGKQRIHRKALPSSRLKHRASRIRGGEEVAICSKSTGFLEPETTIYCISKWLVQMDDSKFLHEKWLFNQTPILKKNVVWSSRLRLLVRWSSIQFVKIPPP